MQRQVIGASVALLLSTGSVAAQSAGCAAVNGFFTPNSLIHGTFTSLPFSAGETVTLRADSITSDGHGIGGVGIGGGGIGTGPGAFRFIDSSYNTLSGPYGYAFPSGPISETLVVTSGFVGLGWTEDIMLGGLYTTFTNLALSCGITPTVSFGDISKITVAGQQRTLKTALGNNASSRLGRRGENVVTRNTFFLSTQNFAGDVKMEANAWVSFGARAYFSGYEGHSVDLMFGIDHLVTDNTLLGVMLGAGSSELEDTLGNDTKTDSLWVGVYGGHRFAESNIILDGYLTYGLVDYDSGATTFDTDRILAGLTVSGTYDVAAGTVSPRARLSGAWEDFPAGTVGAVGGTTRQLLASAGAQMSWNTPLPGTSLLPFASLDVEYGSAKEVGGLSDNFLAPRLGFGVSGMVGRGDLAVSIDVGRTTSNVTDAGFDLSYSFKF